MAKASKSLRLALGGFGLFAVLLLVLQVSLNILISEEFLEEFLEEHLNAEVAVEKVGVSLFKREVSLRGLKLSPRDGERDLVSRVEVKEAKLGVKALPLFQRRLETVSLVVIEPSIRTSLDEEGDWSLADLFRSPSWEGREEDGEREDKAEEEGGALEAKTHGWLAKLGETRLEGGRVELLLEKKELLLEVSDLDIVVNDLQFDPENLATLNQVDLQIRARTVLRDAEEHSLLQIDLAGKAEGKLFDHENGDFDPDVELDLALGEQSYLNPQIKIVRQVWGYLDRVERWGISLGHLPDHIGFGRSRRVAGSYSQEKITLREPLSLSAGKWEVGLAKDSWFQADDGQHEIGVEFLAGKQISETLSGWMQALPKELSKVMENRFVDEQQVLWRVDSSGELSDPEFEFLSQIPESKDILKDLERSFKGEADKIGKEAGRFLKGLLD